MIYEKTRWNIRLIRNFCLFIEVLLPSLGALQRLVRRCICHNDASWDISNVERLECCLGAHVRALVPELHSDFLAINPHNFEWKILVDTYVCLLFWFMNAIILLLLISNISWGLVYSRGRIGSSIIILKHLYNWCFASKLLAHNEDLGGWLLFLHFNLLGQIWVSASFPYLNNYNS